MTRGGKRRKKKAEKQALKIGKARESGKSENRKIEKVKMRPLGAHHDDRPDRVRVFRFPYFPLWRFSEAFPISHFSAFPLFRFSDFHLSRRA
jgi:hypothetical protein